jgi:hypothetical protein
MLLSISLWHLQIAVYCKIQFIVPISKPTDATCDIFLFSIYMCITLHVSSVKRSSSGVPHRAYSLQFLELKLCFKWVLNIKTLKLLKLLPHICTMNS